MEMKTPCVVAIKTATKFFRDGDIVEVDALKGVVKIVN
jgi:phosphohistidine swiveling domain-containing protein